MQTEIKFVTNEMVDEKFINDLKTAFPAEEDNPDWDLEAIKKFIQNNRNKFLVAYLGDEIAGFLYGFIFDRLDKNPPKFYIHVLATRKEFQQQGVMTAIINYLIKTLKEQGYGAVWLLTDEENVAAINLYNKTIGNPKNQIMFGKDF